VAIAQRWAGDRPEASTGPTRRRLGEVLVDSGVITATSSSRRCGHNGTIRASDAGSVR
jgi:hypothetical protein